MPLGILKSNHFSRIMLFMIADQSSISSNKIRTIELFALPLYSRYRIL